MIHGEVNRLDTISGFMVSYWLMKSEPDVYPWEQLVEDGETHWDGVRNYQARNFMRDDMKVGDLVFFYHSNCKPPHIAGIAVISKQGYPDFTALDAQSKYFDPKSSEDNPRWFMVNIKPVIGIDPISLTDLKLNPKLVDMPLIQKGQRLSVQPVPKECFKIICQIAEIDEGIM